MEGISIGLYQEELGNCFFLLSLAAGCCFDEVVAGAPLVPTFFTWWLLSRCYSHSRPQEAGCWQREVVTPGLSPGMVISC